MKRWQSQVIRKKKPERREIDIDDILEENKNLNFAPNLRKRKHKMTAIAEEELDKDGEVVSANRKKKKIRINFDKYGQEPIVTSVMNYGQCQASILASESLRQP